MITIYTLGNCDTCRRAIKWLTAHELEFEERPIRERPPSLAELRVMLAAQQGERRRLLNVTGRDYREQKLAEKLPGISDGELVTLLAANGNLIKRPFLLAPGVGLTGFNAEVWTAALLQQ